MSLPKYPKYKDSGVEWLGEVPQGWELMKLKAFSTTLGGGTPSRDNLEFWNGSIPWVSPKDMKSERIIDSEERITQKGLASSATSMIEPGAVLLVVRSGILKHTIPIAINDVPVSLNQDMKAIKLNPSLCQPIFILRWVQGLNDILLHVWLKQGATVESVEHEYLANTVFPLPPLPEQTAIAAFLDRETSKIDALVSEQEKLIALLKEKRQALISHAVTKGLDPKAKMKDSGVEWLGEVPQGWEVLPFKYVSDFFEGPGILAQDFHDDGVPLIRISGLSGEVASLEGCNYLNPEKVNSKWSHFKLSLGDLLISGSASTDLIVEVKEQAVGAIPYTGIIVIRPKSEICLKPFIKYFFSSELFKVQVLLNKTGSTIQHFGPTHLSRMCSIAPPLPEQIAIAAFLDRETGKIDALMQEAERGSELLKERRSALISAAVTGKIDVRGLS